MEAREVIISFFDLFTGSGGSRAQAGARQASGEGFDTNVDTLGQGFDQARGEVGSGFDAGLNTLTGSREDITGGGAAALDAIAQGRAGAQGAFGQARGAFDQAGDRFAPVENLAGEFGRSREALFDALGFGGAEGLGRAETQFGNNLRSNFALDQGLEAITRRNAAATGGGATGGNVDRDAQIFGQDRAFADTGDFLNRLTGLANQEAGLVSGAAAGRSGADIGRANVFGREADLLSNTGLNQAQVSQNTAQRLQNLASQIAGVQQQRGGALGELTLGEAEADIGLQRGRTNDIISTILGQNQARAGGAQNIVGAGTELARLLASLVPGGGGGSRTAMLPTGGLR